MPPDRPLVYFITPAWQRFEMTGAVLEQRAQIIAYLDRHGIEGRQVVIADDENLDIARSFGFDTVERDNDTLGRRFNDGFEHAARNGADWIVPIGSDSFLDPAYLLPLPTRTIIRTSHTYAVCERERIAALTTERSTRLFSSAGPYMIPRKWLPSSLRPAHDYLKRGVDRSTLSGIWRHIMLRVRSMDRMFEYRTLHPWQYVGFRGQPQLNRYDKLVRHLGTGTETHPMDVLPEHYPPDLVRRALNACVGGRDEVAA